MKRFLFVLAVSGLALAMVPSAFGDVFSFFLTKDKSPLSSPPADAVLVAVNRSGNRDATVTFTGETISSNTYYIGNISFNVDGDFSVGTIAGSSSPSQTYDAAGVGSLDSFGQMSEEITPNGGHPSSVTIALSAIGGNSWDNAFDVLTRTCGSYSNNPAWVGGFGVAHPAGSTGYGHQYTQGFDAAVTVGTSPTNHTADEDLAGFEVPEPASLLLFGSGVFLLATLARRKSYPRILDPRSFGRLNRVQAIFSLSRR